MKFPQVTGSNLSRQRYRLPHDFEGDVNLVLVAFQQVHQLDVNTWLPLAQSLAAHYSQLRYYELPVIRRMNVLYQSFIDGGMRAGIPDQTARNTTITLYTDKAAFRQALEIPGESAIYVFLVTPAGDVLWQTSGRYSTAKEAELRAVLAAKLETAVTPT